MIKHILIAFAMLVCLNNFGFAAPTQLTEEQTKKLQTHFQTMFEKLNLNSAQQEKFVPVMRDSMKQKFEILKKYGFTKDQRPKLNFKQKLSLRDDMNASQETSNKVFSSFLNATQMEKLKDIQNEARAKMRDRILNGKK